MTVPAQRLRNKPMVVTPSGNGMNDSSTAATTTATTYSNNSNKSSAASNSAIVASLTQRSPHPYSAISLSPTRKFAITASKDTLRMIRISPQGIGTTKSVPISQYFHQQASSTSSSTPNSGGTQKNSNPFYAGHANSNSNNHGNSSSSNNNNGSRWMNSTATVGNNPTASSSLTVVIHTVAWSCCSRGQSSTHTTTTTTTTTATPTAASKDDETASLRGQHQPPQEDDHDSFIAAAGSNGAILIWDASCWLDAAAPVPPAAILGGHTGRAVNQLAWHPQPRNHEHPTKHNNNNNNNRGAVLLLSASQDCRVILWQRTLASSSGSSSDATITSPMNAAGGGKNRHNNNNNNSSNAKNRNKPKSGGSWWLGNIGMAPDRSPDETFTWQAIATFEPKSEPVRDLRWSPFHPEVFALVTSGGSLICYNRYLPNRALLKVSAHSQDATTVDWHPVLPCVLATGAAGDRSVKVWDLEPYLMFKKEDSNIGANTNTWTSRAESVGTDSTENDGSNLSWAMSSTAGTLHHSSVGRTMNSMSSMGRSSKAERNVLYVLHVAAAVTCVRWRPPASEHVSLLPRNHKSNNSEAPDAGTTTSTALSDRHNRMLAVSTAPIKGVAGGSGMVALWTCDRPYQPLSVLEGHKDGAVTGFEWLETLQPEPRRGTTNTGVVENSSRRGTSSATTKGASRSSKRREHTKPRRGAQDGAEVVLHQSQRMPPHGLDTFLQNDSNEHDEASRMAIWQHVISVGRDGRCLLQSFVRGDRPISRVSPSCFAMANLSPFQKGYGSLQFFSVKQKVPVGWREEFAIAGLRRDAITAQAPGIFKEVPLITTESDESKVQATTKNRDSTLAQKIPSGPPRLVFNVVDQGDLDDDAKPVEGNQERPLVIAPEVVHLSRFANQYVLCPNNEFPSRVNLCRHNANVAEKLQCGPLAHMWRIVGSILESAGVDGLPDESSPKNAMQFVILPTIRSLLEERADAGDVQTCVALCEVLQVVKPDQTCRIPGLDVAQAREWYLAYIDLLRDMCLFSNASNLIWSCKDPFIAALSQTSTTIHESCPHCGKPLLTGEGGDPSGVRRACKSCRRRIGLCFLCHEPVTGMYVWCPGCGHGGHMDHALQWFGGG